MELQFLIPIVGIIFGTALTGLIFWKIIDLVKTWITRNNSSYDEEKIDRMAKAFVKHKKEMERRVQNLEAIVTDEESESASASSSRRRLNEPKHDTIEIDTDDSRQQKEASGSGKLDNMLKNKQRTQ